jgi:hypothetical protein
MNALVTLREQVPFAVALPWHVPITFAEIIASTFGTVSAVKFGIEKLSYEP